MTAHTTTHTWTWVAYADPFLICDVCGERAEGYIVSPGHDEDWANYPCEHRCGITSTCPSWSPVDGCRCQDHLGYVPHPPADSRSVSP